MTLPTKTVQTFVADMIAAWQAQTGVAASFDDGDVLLAWWQSTAIQLDFLQAQIQLVVAMARAQTSTGADLDSFFAQFGFTRLPATFSAGPETFSRSVAAGVNIVIPVGSIVQTVGGDLQYQVVADTEAAFDPIANGYVLAAGQTSIVIPVQATLAGSASNVLAGAVTQFGSSVSGIDSVNNDSPFTDGGDAESDVDYRSRFVLFLATLAKATKSALLAAALSVQQGLKVNLFENELTDGTPLMGSFTGIIDDGSGNPSVSLLNAVYAAFDVTRAFSVQPFVSAPVELPVVIDLSIRLSPGAVAAVVNTAVQNAIAAMVNELGPGDILYTWAIGTAAATIPGVVAVDTSSISINSQFDDLTPTIIQEARTSLQDINVLNY